MPYVRGFQLISKLQQQTAPQSPEKQGAFEHADHAVDIESLKEDGYAG
jgi:hypothetical protein